MNRYFRTLICSMALGAFALLAGCNKPPEAGEVAQTTAAHVADADVTANVKAALLRDPVLTKFAISVITLKGDVRLTGIVDTQSQIDAAIKLTRGADGVHSIHDELTLKK